MMCIGGGGAGILPYGPDIKDKGLNKNSSKTDKSDETRAEKIIGRAERIKNND